MQIVQSPLLPTGVQSHKSHRAALRVHGKDGNERCRLLVSPLGWPTTRQPLL